MSNMELAIKFRAEGGAKIAQEVNGLGDNATEKELHIFAALIGQPSDLVMEMHMKDYSKLQTAYNDFLA